jgi:hypothetical protein
VATSRIQENGRAQVENAVIESSGLGEKLEADDE